MKIEDTFPLGIGTFRFDLAQQERGLEALRASFELGQNFIDTSYLYDDGKNLELIAKFLRTISRDEIYISLYLEKFVESVTDIHYQLDRDLEILDVDYVDCLMVHEPAVSKIPLVETYAELDKIKQLGGTKSLGGSNFSPEELRIINKQFPLDVFVGVYNLENKVYEDLGALDYCREYGIEFVAYQPLRRNRTAMTNYPELVALADKYDKTQNQIVLNWLVRDKKIRPMIKSENIERIKENASALSFDMTSEDYAILNHFRAKRFDEIKIDWTGVGDDGIVVHQLPNQQI